MKKNRIMKGILLLIVLALLTIGFTGCGAVIIIPTTGTVVITIQGSYTYYNYNIYLDGGVYPIGTTSGGGYAATNITPGWHTFYAYDSIWDYYWNYGTVYVTAGQTSYLTLYPW